jgi:hypothetical protein
MSKDDYDIIIDIDSIRFLNKTGWKINYPRGDEKNLKKIIKSTKKNIVAILGHSNRGKTFILQKISEIKLKEGYQVQTKGISIKIPEGQNILLLDTQGTNAPLLLAEGEEDKRMDPDFNKELDNINLCQIITNYIIQTFIIKEADTLICVVGMLTASEIIFLNKVKKNCGKNKKLIVIHNLPKLFSIEQIQDYIKGTLLDNIIIQFEERNIPDFNQGEDNKINKYYVEFDETHGSHKTNILHFILGNDNVKEIKEFNKSTIKFIQDYIDVRINKNVNIIEKLIEHVNNLSSSVLIKPIKLKVNENLDIIKYDGKIEPKEIIADELDNVTFIGNYYEPQYKWYKKENHLIIDINICSKINEETLKVRHKSKDELEIFQIKGERLICGKEKNEKKISIHSFINKRMNSKKFLLNFQLNLTEKGIISISGDYKHSIDKGILSLSFEIIN